ncbi:MAG: transcription antitermination factor NusB [Balneolaceae bacterium]
MLQRRAARQAALKAYYAVEVGKNSTQEATKEILKTELPGDTELLRFAEKLLLITVDHRAEYDEIISGYTKNWEVDRLATIDKFILRLALTELLHFSDIPTKVSINEAIELAKLFSTRNSGTFVNGILDSIANDFIKSGRIEKKGRGLIDHSGGS